MKPIRFFRVLTTHAVNTSQITKVLLIYSLREVLHEVDQLFWRANFLFQLAQVRVNWVGFSRLLFWFRFRYILNLLFLLLMKILLLFHLVSQMTIKFCLLFIYLVRVGLVSLKKIHLQSVLWDVVFEDWVFYVCFVDLCWVYKRRRIWRLLEQLSSGL